VLAAKIAIAEAGLRELRERLAVLDQQS